MADSDELLLPQVRLLRECLRGARKRGTEREQLSMEGPLPGVRNPGRMFLLVLFLAFAGLTFALVVLSFPAGIYAVFSGQLSKSFTYSTLVRPLCL